MVSIAESRFLPPESVGVGFSGTEKMDIIYRAKEIAFPN